MYFVNTSTYNTSLMQKYIRQAKHEQFLHICVQTSSYYRSTQYYMIIRCNVLLHWHVDVVYLYTCAYNIIITYTLLSISTLQSSYALIKAHIGI
jgi:hypothetical protein